jgi:hypothetical protein
MSGGHWNYIQHQLIDIVFDIEKIINKNGKPKTYEELKEESWRDTEWYKRYPEDLIHYKYPDEVIVEFKKALEITRKAFIYIRRIDYLISGDDSEESFLENLKEGLEQMNETY